MSVYIAPLHNPKVKPGTSAKALLENLGMNTGNMVFENSVRRQINYDDAIQITQLLREREELKPSKVVIPSSTFLNPAGDFEYYASVIEKLDCEIILVGVGVHLGRYVPVREFASSLTQGTKRFVEIVSERSSAIGCRGGYTADVLNCLGHRSVQIVGCPSVYNYKPPVFRDGRESICLTIEPYSRTSGKLFEFARKNQHAIVMQTKWEMIDSELERSFSDFRNLYKLRSLEEAPALQFYRESCNLFSDSQTWKEFLGDFSFVLGSRFHGNAIALQAGLPALWISHDIRLRELCDFFHLPQVSEDFIASKELSLSVLRDKYDYSDFLKHIDAKTADYKSFLAANGLKVKPLDWS